MSGAERASGRPDYGLDAPGVVRNLFLAGGAGLLVWATAAAGLLVRGAFGHPALEYRARVRGELRGDRRLDGVGQQGRQGPGPRAAARPHALDAATRVLDVGCGRGSCWSARPAVDHGGRATGIDIWQAEDLSGNRPEATLENATREGVADRVEDQDGGHAEDAVSRRHVRRGRLVQAVHNIYDPKGAARPSARSRAC